MYSTFVESTIFICTLRFDFDAFLNVQRCTLKLRLSLRYVLRNTMTERLNLKGKTNIIAHRAGPDFSE